MSKSEQNLDCNRRRRIAKAILLMLFVELSCFGFINLTLSQQVANTVNAVPLPWHLNVSPETFQTKIPQCWATFTVTINGTSQGNVRILFNWLTVSSGNLFYDETYTSKGQKIAGSFRFDFVVEGPPQTPTTHILEVSAHDDIPTNGDWRDYGVAMNQKVSVTVITPSSYPPGSYCQHYTYTARTGTAVDMTQSSTKATATYTWTYRTMTWDWWDWRYWWYGDRWPWTTGESFDFALEAIPPTYSVKAGQSATYSVSVRLLSGVRQPVTLSLSGLSAGTSGSLSVSAADPTFVSRATVTTGDALQPGTYTLTVLGAGGGKTHSATINLDVSSNKQQSSLSISVNPTAAQYGETISIGGALSPGLGTTIELCYTRPDGFEMIKHVTTGGSGAFSDTFKPEIPGQWSVRARWSGGSAQYGSESSAVSFSVVPAAEKQQSLWDSMQPALLPAAIVAIVLLVVAVLLKQRSRERSLSPKVAVKVFCTNCGAELPPRSTFCNKCGSALN